MIYWRMKQERRGVMAETDKPLTAWQIILARSVINGADNLQDYLPAQHWDWPKSTWFQARLEQQKRKGEQGANDKRTD